MIDETIKTPNKEEPKVIEPKKEEKVEKPVEPTTRQLSDKDAHVANVIASQAEGFPSVDVVEKTQNLFELPKECKLHQNKYDFRWVSKDPRMLDRAQVKGWRYVNRANCSWIPQYLIGAHGGVEKYGHILAFRPVELSSAYREKYRAKSIANIKEAKKDDVRDKKDSPFYTAKMSSPDGDDKEAGGLVQDRDF